MQMRLPHPTRARAFVPLDLTSLFFVIFLLILGYPLWLIALFAHIGFFPLFFG
jgi:TRAP-type C4-dicarboxylate transport system permease small subunit